MEKLWSLMWLKAKRWVYGAFLGGAAPKGRGLTLTDHHGGVFLFREQRQPTLQVLAVFLCKAANTQQTVTSTDDTLGAEVLRATTRKITKTARVGKRMRGQRTCRKGSPNSAAPTAGGGTPLTTCVGLMAGGHSTPMPLCKET